VYDITQSYITTKIKTFMQSKEVFILDFLYKEKKMLGLNRKSIVSITHLLVVERIYFIPYYIRYLKMPK